VRSVAGIGEYTASPPLLQIAAIQRAPDEQSAGESSLFRTAITLAIPIARRAPNYRQTSAKSLPRSGALPHGEAFLSRQSIGAQPPPALPRALDAAARPAAPQPPPVTPQRHTDALAITPRRGAAIARPARHCSQDTRPHGLPSVYPPPIPARRRSSAPWPGGA
jgi:hypothetical protein